MFKKILISLLICSSGSLCGGFDFYTNSSRMYSDVITYIPQMRDRYMEYNDGNIVYVLSEKSGNDFCWMKEIDSNGVSKVWKFYVDWTNGKYTPETYGRQWNEMCKNSKRRKKFVDTDGMINLMTNSIKNSYNKKKEIIMIRRLNSKDFYYIEKDEPSGEYIMTLHTSKFDVSVLYNNLENDSIPVLIHHYPRFYIKNIKISKKEHCDASFKNTEELITTSAFLEKLRLDGFPGAIKCEE